MNHAIGKRLVIAGGGTGGHLFPGIAVADAFLRRNSANQVLFIGTDRPMEIELLRRHGFAHQAIAAYGFKGLGLRGLVRALTALPAAVQQARFMLTRFQPHLVLGVGGYSAGPVGLAAAINGIPLAIHEQNIWPGITNRLLAPWAKMIFISAPAGQSGFRRSQTRFTGNPIRRQLLETVSGAHARRPDTPPCLLVLGGSQGAAIINHAMMAAAPLLDTRIHIVHQTGAEQAAKVRRAYAAAGITCTVKPFFHDMAACYHMADLIVSRAGATTLAEITALGKAAILIPFAHAADNHQFRNACRLKHADAADYIVEDNLDAADLAKRIRILMLDRRRLTAMAGHARRLGRPAAALIIVQHCYRLMATGHCR